MVEEATLHGNFFNHKQREFIELMESKYIIAGPGTGKTTSLSAKIVLLLLNSIKNNSKDGICVITKTNVAVDEINRILNHVGKSKMKHPHFVGTIHQFFNTYLATPFIQKVLNPKQIRFAKESDYLQLLTQLAERHPYFRRWQERPRSIAVQKTSISKLYFDFTNKKFDIENSTGWDKFDRHRTHMFELKWSLKKLSCFSFDDIFLFSKAAIQNDKGLSLLRKRFKYVFIDEFQDTEKGSIDLITRIFNSNSNVIQYIGDPNQTLDFEGEMPSIDLSNAFNLNICNRFGYQIGKQLPYIVDNLNIQCLEDKYSFNPMLLIYTSKKKLIDNYKIQFSKYLKDQRFSAVKKKDSILGIQNNTINEYLEEPNNIKSSRTRIKDTESFTIQIINLLQEILFHKIPNVRNNNIILRDWLKEHPTYRSLKICIVRSIKAGKLEVSLLVDYLNELIYEKGGQGVKASNSVFSKISSIIDHIYINPVQTEEDHKFTFSTIHSVKGETHRSVLLIDSEKDKNPKIHTKMIKSYFCEWDEDLSGNWVERNLLYVAMSRPTHLFTFAMDRNFITNEEIEMFRLKGWDISFTRETES